MFWHWSDAANGHVIINERELWFKDARSCAITVRRANRYCELSCQTAWAFNPELGQPQASGKENYNLMKARLVGMAITQC